MRANFLKLTITHSKFLFEIMLVTNTTLQNYRKAIIILSAVCANVLHFSVFTFTFEVWNSINQINFRAVDLTTIDMVLRRIIIKEKIHNGAAWNFMFYFEIFSQSQMEILHWEQLVIEVKFWWIVFWMSWWNYPLFSRFISVAVRDYRFEQEFWLSTNIYIWIWL